MFFLFFCFLFFFNSVLRLFQDYFSSCETGQSIGGRKREDPKKNHLAHPQAELGLSANSYMKLVWDKQIRKRCEQFRFY